METPEDIFISQIDSMVDLKTMPVHQSIFDATGIASIDSWMAEILHEPVQVQSNSIPDATGIATLDSGMEEIVFIRAS